MDEASIIWSFCSISLAISFSSYVSLGGSVAGLAMALPLLVLGYRASFHSVLTMVLIAECLGLSLLRGQAEFPHSLPLNPTDYSADK